jgi:hypothetical protein
VNALLRRHALLQHHRAQLCEIEVAKAQGELILGKPAIEFLSTVLKVVYRAIWAGPELSTRGQDEICEVVRQHVLVHIKDQRALGPILSCCDRTALSVVACSGVSMF